MQPVTLGGRRFGVPTASTIEHDLWCTERLTRAGLRDFETHEGEDPEALARRLVDALVASEVLWELLGAFLLPEGVGFEAWRPELGRSTGEFVRTLSAPDDKARVQVLAVTLLLGFFGKGLVSFRISRRSSTSPGAGAGPETGSTETGERGPMASGAGSSGASPATTPTGPGASCAGPCERPCLH